MFPLMKLSIVSVVLAAVLAPAARADGFGFEVTKHGKHGSFEFRIGGGDERARPPQAPVRPPPSDWIPGHYETVVESVWVEGAEQRVWEPALFEWRRDACGRSFQVCVRAGFWRNVCTPGRFEQRPRQVWCPGGWRMRPCGN
jgi:hypothetical protein